MELRGQLRNWNDQKGFGFIRPERGGAEVFAHISVMRGDRRPEQGDTVFYLSQADQAGRLRATHIRLDAPLALDDPAIRRKPAGAAKGHMTPPRRHEAPRRRLLELAGLILLCLLPGLGLLKMSERGHDWPLLAYALASLVTFGFYLHDKRSAQRGRWRTPEMRLHLLELLGGWPGTFIAQQLLRHKTRKLPFQFVFWMIVLALQVAWLDYLYLHRLAGWLAG